MARLNRAFPPAPLAASPVPYAARPARRRLPAAAIQRAALAASVIAAVALAHLASDDAASARAVAADPELARLLRAMALVKGSMAVAAVWLADRLLREELAAGLAAGLALAVALMAAAPVLMWQIAPVALGALLFHAGMVLLLVLGWRPAGAWLTARWRNRHPR